MKHTHRLHGIAQACAIFALSVCLSQAVQAEAKPDDDLLKDWTLSGGLVHSRSERSSDVAPSRNWANSFVFSGVKRHDDKFSYGGSLAYSRGKATTASDDGTTDTKVMSGSLFAMRLIDHLILLNANLSYGDVDLDNTHMSGANTVTFDGDSSFWALGVGATKIVPFANGVTATASANYNFSYADSESYSDSAGGRTPGDTTTRNTIALGGGVSWRIDDRWTPNAKLSWHYSPSRLYNGTNDRDYFSYAVGTSYALLPDTKLSAAYRGAFAKTDTRDHALSLTVSVAF